MDVENLIERLRAESLYKDKATLEIMDLCMDAAAVLSTLQTENKKLRAELEQKSKLIVQQAEEMERRDALLKEQEDELEQVKRERDAIEQDFRAFAKQWWEQDSGFPCCWCKFEKSSGCEWKVKHPGEICEGRAFEWRGPQKED